MAHVEVPGDRSRETGRSAGRMLRFIGLALVLAGALSAAIAIGAFSGHIYGTVDVHGQRYPTYPDGLLLMLFSGGIGVVLLFAGVMLWICGAAASARRGAKCSRVGTE